MNVHANHAYTTKFLSTVLSPATYIDLRRWGTCHAGLAALTRSIRVTLCQPTPAGRTASTRISPHRSWGPEWAEHERVRAVALHTDVLESTASVPLQSAESKHYYNTSLIIIHYCNYCSEFIVSIINNYTKILSSTFRKIAQ